MEQENAKNQPCPRTEIAAYIDGELGAREELDLEMHFACCPTCCEELNEQKKLLCALDFALENKEEIELPENFTKVVVATAESNVKGLRCPKERNRALFVFAALFLIAIFGLGAETSKTVETLGNLGEQFFAVGGFFVHLIHDITLAVTVFLRSLCLQFVFNSAISAAVIGIFFVLSFLIFSRLISRHKRF
jgi:anti-sigma factor RsiW